MEGKKIRYDMGNNDLREGLVHDKVLIAHTPSGYNNSYVSITKYLVEEDGGTFRLIKPVDIFEVLTP